MANALESFRGAYYVSFGTDQKLIVTYGSRVGMSGCLGNTNSSGGTDTYSLGTSGVIVTLKIDVLSGALATMV